MRKESLGIHGNSEDRQVTYHACARFTLDVLKILRKRIGISEGVTSRYIPLISGICRKLWKHNPVQAIWEEHGAEYAINCAFDELFESLKNQDKKHGWAYWLRQAPVKEARIVIDRAIQLVKAENEFAAPNFNNF